MTHFSPIDYTIKTRATVQYPADMALSYLVLGLTSEIGELAAVLKSSPLDLENIKKEAGDILWYCFRLLDELQIPAVHYWSHYNKVLDLFPGDIEKLSEMYANVSAVSDIVKKSIRDNRNVVPQTGKDVILYCIDAIISIIVDIGNTKLSLPPEYIAAANIVKLASRKQRGVISGSGDAR